MLVCDKFLVMTRFIIFFCNDKDRIIDVLLTQIEIYFMNQCFNQLILSMVQFQPDLLKLKNIFLLQNC
jgi:hypothetical protein